MTATMEVDEDDVSYDLSDTTLNMDVDIVVDGHVMIRDTGDSHTLAAEIADRLGVDGESIRVQSTTIDERQLYPDTEPRYETTIWCSIIID